MSAPEPTHTQYAAAVLRVEPHALPTVRAAFAQALDVLLPHLQRMRREAVITEDWLGDENSRALRDFYNQQVMAAPDGPFTAIVKYGNLLKDVHDQLAAAEAEYRRVEGDNSALWGRA